MPHPPDYRVTHKITTTNYHTVRPAVNGFPSRLPLLISLILSDAPITLGSASSNRYGSLAGSVVTAAGPRFDCGGGLETNVGLISADIRWHRLMLVTANLPLHHTHGGMA